MRWSVGIEAEGDRVLTREQVVELADAVAASGGIATGIGTSRFGAQLIVEAASREEALKEPERGAYEVRLAQMFQRLFPDESLADEKQG